MVLLNDLLYLLLLYFISIRQYSYPLFFIVCIFLKPDVFVMSVTTKDFPVEKKEAIEKFVGQVVVFEPQAETSSTARIRLLMVDGASGLAERVTETVKTFLSQLGKD